MAMHIDPRLKSLEYMSM